MHSASASISSTTAIKDVDMVETASTGAEAQHELGDLQKPALPIEDDLMQLARLGELRSVQKLFESGKYTPNSADEQGITALHWAAINGHYALCHFLLQSGANPNVKGGDALATPVLWASKKCQLNVVSLLLQSGADPLITDDAGYNLLHCATLDGNVFPLILLLHQPGIPVDVPDSQGHTSLMWAAYKGYPACVDVLLQWGADVNARDEQGFTALHWALVKGSQACVQKLVEYGADRFAANNEGKTPAVTAREMNSSSQWYRALQQSGYDRAGNAKPFPIKMVEDKRKFLWRFYFVLPFYILGLSLWLASSQPIYFGLPSAAATIAMIQWSGSLLLKWGPSNFNQMYHTPFFAGVFSGTLAWVGIVYVAQILPQTITTNFLYNILFMTVYAACCYFYFSAMLSDPGFVPKAESRGQTKDIIEELIGNDSFDERHFCSICMIRKPLRSKHCKRCGRCVAKEDHHCPWLDNCVAVNNHKHFMLYVLTLIPGIVLYDWLFLSYLTPEPGSPSPQSDTCTILSPALCGLYLLSPFSVLLTLWTSLQLIWVVMLLAVHLTQIARGVTTFEAMRGHSHSHSHSHASLSLSQTSTGAAANLPLSAAAAIAAGSTDPSTIGPAPPKSTPRTGWWITAKRLLGLDTVLATAMYGSRAQERLAANKARPRNPYNRGVLGNCTDFWGPIGGDDDASGGGGGSGLGAIKACVGDAYRIERRGRARLGGRTVDYRRLYDLEGMRYQRGGYEALDEMEGGQADEL